MPDTPGKRQRNALKAKKREEKEERRAARKSGYQPPAASAWDDPVYQIRRHEPTDGAERSDEQAEGGPVERDEP